MHRVHITFLIIVYVRTYIIMSRECFISSPFDKGAYPFDSMKFVKEREKEHSARFAESR